LYYNRKGCLLVFLAGKWGLAKKAESALNYVKSLVF